jgi:hypothetical protein
MGKRLVSFTIQTKYGPITRRAPSWKSPPLPMSEIETLRHELLVKDAQIRLLEAQLQALPSYMKRNGFTLFDFKQAMQRRPAMRKRQTESARIARAKGRADEVADLTQQIKAGYRRGGTAQSIAGGLRAQGVIITPRRVRRLARS